MGSDLRILLLARSFPPGESVAALRARHLATHLVRLGCEVEVVTVDPVLLERPGVPWHEGSSGARVRYSGHRGRVLLPGYLRYGMGWKATRLDRIAQAAARRLQIDSGWGWIRSVERACADLRPGDVDVIVATAPPWSAFLAASRLAERLHCPWVMDYRDAWTLSPHGEAPRARVVARERNLLAHASAVVTVSPSMAEGMKEHFGLSSVTTVTNGFDPDLFREIRPTLFKEPAFVYTGNIYPPKRVLDPVLAALRLLRERGRAGRLHYYGHAGSAVREAARRLSIEERVEDHGAVTHAEALSAVAGARAAVVVTSVDEIGSVWDNSIVTGKVFEPLGLGTPILLVAPVGSDARAIVRDTHSGVCVHGGQIEEIATFLDDPHDTAWSFRNTDQYSWSGLARRYLDLLLSLSHQSQSRP